MADCYPAEDQGEALPGWDIPSSPPRAKRDHLTERVLRYDGVRDRLGCIRQPDLLSIPLPQLFWLQVTGIAHPSEETVGVSTCSPRQSCRSEVGWVWEANA